MIIAIAGPLFNVGRWRYAKSRAIRHIKIMNMGGINCKISTSIAHGNEDMETTSAVSEADSYLSGTSPCQNL